MPFDRKDRPPRVTLIVGGARSGKSRHGEALIERAERAALYVATAEAHDDEMRARIAAHRARRGPRWTTLEEPLELAALLRHEPGLPMLIDCLTLWISNLMHAGRDIDAEIGTLVAALDRCAGPVALVANEVGMGIVPENELARRFRDHAGRLNQTVAAHADHVVFMAAGLPLVLKG
jgi:adenosylcobinamide kinase / adenosylcobinamide-phosphate guanylyltransferase